MFVPNVSGILPFDIIAQAHLFTSPSFFLKKWRLEAEKFEGGRSKL